MIDIYVENQSEYVCYVSENEQISNEDVIEKVKQLFDDLPEYLETFYATVKIIRKDFDGNDIVEEFVIPRDRNKDL